MENENTNILDFDTNKIPNPMNDKEWGSLKFFFYIIKNNIERGMKYENEYQYIKYCDYSKQTKEITVCLIHKTKEETKKYKINRLTDIKKIDYIKTFVCNNKNEVYAIEAKNNKETIEKKEFYEKLGKEIGKELKKDNRSNNNYHNNNDSSWSLNVISGLSFGPGFGNNFGGFF